MEKLDDVTASILKAARIDESELLTLSRDDLRDLLPGPEHFMRRKRLWRLINPDEGGSTKPEVMSSPKMASTSSPTSSPTSPPMSKSPPKTLQLPSPPEYVVYTDGELEQCRRIFFEMARVGKEDDCMMSKELRCRLVRNTITTMVSLLRASQGQEVRYPSKIEVTAMAKRIVEYYPMLQDKDNSTKHGSINSYLYKRLQNMKSPLKKQGPTPERGRPKRRRIDLTACEKDEEDEANSSGSTFMLSPSSSSDDQPMSLTKDSLPVQARHYKTLQEMYKKLKPNQDAVSQLLDLEFPARRAYIDCGAIREDNRALLILDAYPCFKELHHVLGEMRRILDPQNEKFIEEVKSRWEEFCARVQFYGVWKKAIKPPINRDKTEAHIALLKALPTLFPSAAPPSKKLGCASEAILHTLEPTEDPNVFIQKRGLSSPVLLFDESKCIIAVGTLPVTSFEKEKLHDGLIFLMSYYYTLHLTYPTCVATLLSVIQTEVLQDAIHEQDTTTSYKRALAEWQEFIGK